MGKRAEYRRAERENKKGISAVDKFSSVPLNIANYNMQQISSLTGAKVESLMIWKNAREEEMYQAFTEEFQQRLFKAEDYIAVANLLISLLAIKMTWGLRKPTRNL